MMDDELKLVGFRQWDDVDPVRGAAPRPVTRIRFYLGDHGPFERTFDRGVDMTVITGAITDQRNALRQIANL